MNLSEVYLRQLDEKLTQQLRCQEAQIDVLKIQIKLLRAIEKTNKDMETYIKETTQN